MAQPNLNITSLLNSLHSHLQSQTQLLPALHGQLGLPQSALADELTTLQQQLNLCVESQIDARRKQVQEWTDKCDEIERQCFRYNAALGGNVKASGTSIGELRKEHVLPTRHQKLSAHQEKLRQLYHSKLEQLNTLTNRIATLARTLGSEFYPADILEPAPAPGAESHDVGDCRDVTPERFSRLEKELVRGKGEVTKRLTQLHETFIQIDWLYSELGITPPSLEDLPPPPPNPVSTSSSLTIPPFPRSGSSSTSLSASTSINSDPFLCSMSTPTPSSRNDRATLLFHPPSSDEPSPDEEIEFQRVFAHFALRIEESSQPLPPPKGLESVEPSQPLLAWSQNTLTSLVSLKTRRESHIQAMYDQLEALWRRLGVTDGEMDGFVEEHRGSTESVVRAYEEELERMLELKRERMGVFVMNARTEIEGLWEELMVGEVEKADFAPFYDDEHTEELLTLHEEEIQRLKEERRFKGPLLASIKKYFEICEEEKELAAAATDQSRLLGRGARDPGRLLREEKMRKRVKKEKPRLEQDLLASIPSWETAHGRPFLVHGESILRILMDTVGPTMDKENKRKPAQQHQPPPQAPPRAGSVPPRSKTPSNSNAGSGAYMPRTTGTGVVTPAVRPLSSMGSAQSAPNKRPRLGDSTSGNVNRPSSSHARSGSNGHHRSPSKSGLPVKMLSASVSSSASLPRPTPVHMVMPVPQLASQHHVLGHGRLPSTQAAGYHQQPQQSRISSNTSVYALSTSTSSRGYGSGASGVTKKPSRPKESFKPRPSVDVGYGDVGGATRRSGFAGMAVKEEDECL